MTHREALKAFLGTIYLENKQVIDWGSGSKPAWRYIDQKSKGNHWTTVDNAPGIPEERRGDVYLSADITNEIKFDILYDAAFCLEVLEHVEYPDKVMQNINNNLKPSGTLYISVPFQYPIHGDQDYWRFTLNGFELLLKRNGFKPVRIFETVDKQGWVAEAKKWKE